MIKNILKDKLSTLLNCSPESLEDAKPLIAYGIDSMKAIELQAIIEEQWMHNVGFEEILDGLSINTIAERIASNVDNNRSTSNQPKHHVEAPVSYQQIGIKRFDETMTSSSAYHIGTALEIAQQLDVKKFRQALHFMIERHPSLRTFFQENSQHVAMHCKTPLETVSLDPHEIRSFCDAFALKPFDLSLPPLFRIALGTVRQKCTLLVIVFHHLIADLWSLGIFFTELMTCYQTLIEKNALPNLIKPRRSYTDFALEQKQYINSAIGKRDLEALTNLCKEGNPSLALPYDYSTPTVSQKGGHVSFSLSKECSQKLKIFAQSEMTTPFVCLLSTFAALMKIYSGQSRFFLGTTLPGRTHVDWNSCLGLFANVLPIPFFFPELSSLSDIVNLTKKNLSTIYQHAKLPLSYLLEHLVKIKQIKKNPNESPLFQALFVYQQTPLIDRKNSSLIIHGEEPLPFLTQFGLQFRAQKWNIPVSPFELTLYMNESGEQFHGYFEYKTDLFSPKSISLMKEHFVVLLEKLLDKQPYSPSLLVSSEQSSQVKFPLLSDKSIPSLFADLAKKHPYFTMLSIGKERFTYHLVDDYAKKAATILYDRFSIRSGDVIALSLDHSLELIVAINAVLQIGAVILPIDPLTPKSRTNIILQKSQAKLMITGTVCESDIKVWALEPNRLSLEVDRVKQLIVPTHPIHADSIAYIIYTSGSTGEPKGVAVTHKSLINYLLSISDQYGIESPSHLALYSAISFDLTLTTLFLPFVHKHTMHLFPRKDHDAFSQLTQILKNPLITFLKLTPSHLKLILQIDVSSGHLKMLIVGGEQFTTRLAQDVIKHLGPVTIINEYGPTEATIGTIFGTYFDQPTDHSKIVPIDQCIKNTGFSVCDTLYRTLPQNLTGELLLSGICVAVGYWNNTRLTAEKFIPDAKGHGTRVYQSGDLVKYCADGSLHTLGRTDRQIKYHGFRLELAEIEQAICMYPQVQACFVAIYDKETQSIAEKPSLKALFSLCAYIATEQPIDTSSLKAFLSKKLPHYMVPAFFISCERLPTTLHGKIDLSKLSVPEQNTSKAGEKKNFPSTPLQEKLHAIWSEVLNVQKMHLGIQDHFFDLGGDSIASIEIVGKCKTMQIHVTPKDLYTYPTIESLGNYISKKCDNDPSPNRSVVQSYTLTPIQNAFLKTHKKKDHYNQAVLLQFHQEINPIHVEKVFAILTAHHEALRTTFTRTGQRYHAEIQKQDKRMFNLHTFPSSTRVSDAISTLQKSLNIEKGPLIQLGIVQTDSTNYIAIIIHHLIIDGVSWRILLEDFDLAYSAQTDNLRDQVSLLKSDSFGHWAHGLFSFDYKKDQEYWSELEKKISANRNQKVAIPCLVGSRKHRSVTFSSTVSEKAMIQNPLITTNELLLTALAASLPFCNQRKHSLVFLESHGRNSLGSNLDLSRAIGWFTSIFPILLPSDGDCDLETLFLSVKNTISEIPEDGLTYQFLYNLFDTSTFTNALITCFNYLGKFEGEKYKNFSFTPVMDGALAEDETAHYHLEVIPFFRNRKLEMSIFFDPTQYEERSIEDFLEHFEHTIMALAKKIETAPFFLNFSSPHNYLEFTQAAFQHHIDFKNVASVVPATPVQQGMLFEELRTPGQFYIEQAIVEIEGELQKEIWIKAISQLVSESESLRSVFLYQNVDHPYQVILENLPIDINYHDITQFNDEYKEDYLNNLLKSDKKKPYHLSQGPLVRFYLVKKNASQFVFLLCFHHIALDGWSLALLFKQLINLIKCFYNRTALPPRLPSIREYNCLLARKDKNPALTHYKKLLENFESPTIPLPHSTSIHANNSKHHQVKLTLSKELVGGLQAACRKYKVTINTLLQTTWGILLGRYNNSHDVLFGVVNSGREVVLDKVESMIGLFIHTTPVRIRFSESQSLQELLQAVQTQSLLSRSFPQLSLAEIQGLSPLKRDLITHLFIFENYPLSGQAKRVIENAELPFALQSAELQEKTPHELLVTIFPGESYTISMDFSTDRYAQISLSKMLQNWKTLLTGIAQNEVAREIKSLPFIEEEEKKILAKYMQSPSQDTDLLSIHTYFERQVQKAPHRTALVFENTSLTYQQLNQYADSLASYLQQRGCQRETLVGILLDSSLEMVIAWLAVLKAGAAYVPLNPNDPTERIEQILTESDTTLVLSNRRNRHSISAEIVLVDDYINFHSKSLGKKNPQLSLSNLAYVIYTSGSTGKPKGVAVEHKSVANHISWMTKEFTFSQDNTMLLCTDFSFDITICAFYPLFAGGKVVLANPKSKKNLSYLTKAIHKHQITHIQLGADLFGTMLEEKCFSSLHSLRFVFCGGSAFQKKYVEGWHREMSSFSVINMYGPTETSIDASYHTVTTKDLDKNAIPIGKPLTNYELYILQDSLLLSPSNGIGELYIGGIGVARGYYNQPRQTATSFIPNHLNTGRLYKSGDLASWNEDGDLVFHHRRDDQLKIRGLRVELKEIEKHLRDIPGIKEVFVSAVHEKKHQILCAYIAPKNHVEASSIKQLLAKKIPSYMIPNQFVFLDALPLNDRQKVDTTKLPKPKTETNVLHHNQKLSSVEKILQNIWGEILAVEKDEISVSANFFDLGGNSLTLMQLQHQTNKLFSTSHGIETFFQHPSIRDYANFLTKIVPDTARIINIDERKNKRQSYLNNRKNRKR